MQENFGANVQALRPVETDHQLWNRARALEARIAAKEFVEPDELLWLGSFREGSVYRGFLAVYGALNGVAGEIASTDEAASSS
ncbi:hypothetical protein ACWAT4_26425 [Bradyrhizobium manausense]